MSQSVNVYQAGYKNLMMMGFGLSIVANFRPGHGFQFAKKLPVTWISPAKVGISPRRCGFLCDEVTGLQWRYLWFEGVIDQVTV